MKAYKANRFVVMTEKSMRRFTAEEHTDALLNLAVPSPIFRETEPIMQESERGDEGRSSSCSEVREQLFRWKRASGRREGI